MIERPHREEHVRLHVLEVLEVAGAMETAQITRLVKSQLDLAPGDVEQANERNNEVKIDQIIANALSARRFLCKEGLIERIGIGQFRITEKGRAFVVESGRRQSEMDATFIELFGAGSLD